MTSLRGRRMDVISSFSQTEMVATRFGPCSPTEPGSTRSPAAAPTPNRPGVGSDVVRPALAAGGSAGLQPGDDRTNQGALAPGRFAGGYFVSGHGFSRAA